VGLTRGSALNNRKVVARGGERDTLAGWSAVQGAQGRGDYLADAAQEKRGVDVSSEPQGIVAERRQTSAPIATDAATDKLTRGVRAGEMGHGGLVQELVQGTREGGVAASQAQLELLHKMSQEKTRLMALKKHYTLRLASASREDFEVARHQKSNVNPRLQETGDGVVCEGHINKTVSIRLDQGAQDKAWSSGKEHSQAMKDVLHKEGVPLGIAPRLTVRKCWSTGASGSATSAIRALGSVKQLLLDDCHKTMILVDAVHDTCCITHCTNMTLVIGGDMPHFDMTHCTNVTIVGCASGDRRYTLSMSCCQGIMTSVHVSVAYRSALSSLNAQELARQVHLPDTIQATIHGMVVTCELQNSASVSDECLALTADTMCEFQPVDRHHEVASLHSASHEQHQHVKHTARKQSKTPTLGRVEVQHLHAYCVKANLTNKHNLPE